jgi:hypothetical protein
MDMPIVGEEIKNPKSLGAGLAAYGPSAAHLPGIRDGTQN